MSDIFVSAPLSPTFVGQQTTEYKNPEAPIQLPVEPLAARVAVADGGHLIERIAGQLELQLKEFEANYSGFDVRSCAHVIKHFDGVIRLVDVSFEQAKASLLAELSKVQIESIRVRTHLRSCSTDIDNYLATIDATEVGVIEPLVNFLLSGGGEQSERESSRAKLANYPLLLDLLDRHQAASDAAEKSSLTFKRLQDTIVEHRYLKYFVRRRIAQTYEQAGFKDQARALERSARELGAGVAGGISQSIDNVFVESADHRFNAMFKELLAFKAEHGHCDVPRRYKQNQSLAIWVANLRARNKRALLSPKKRRMLEEVGFSWASTRSKWQRMIEELRDFIAINGHSIVPTGYEKCPELAIWVRNLRKECRRKGVSARRINELQEIGFVFEVLDKRWMEKCEQLKMFKESFGHCRVPHHWSDNPGLARWVNLQRERYRENSLPEHRVKILEELGFQWNPPKGRPRG